MAREYGRALTKEMLEEWGFSSIKYLPDFGYEKSDNENDNWYIDRYWYHCNSKEKVHKRIRVQNAVCKHKYTCDKSYPIITFSYNRKVICLPLARIIYAWFKGPISEKDVIDHINNNPYNNCPENLQALNVGKNLAKRFVDNPVCPSNQYETRFYKSYKEKGELYDLVHKMLEAGKSYEEAQQEVLKYICGDMGE